LKDDGITITAQTNENVRRNKDEALYEIGTAYYPFDKKKAFLWFYRAALQGFGEAQGKVGHMYQHGQGVSKNDIVAMVWYRRAADNGDVFSVAQIGGMYEAGSGIPKDISTAIKWYEIAAIHNYVQAQAQLACFYHVTDEFNDLQKAVNWYQKAADNDHNDAKYQLKQVNRQGYYAKNDENGTESNHSSI
jgi:hypothetical protein